MKKNYFVFAFLFCCLPLSFAQKTVSENQISPLRKYDAVLGIEKNMKSAHEYYGRVYQEEMPVSEYGPVGLTEAFDGYRKFAEQGNADALFALGSYYCNNEKIFRHHEIAFAIFTMLRQMGHVPGIHNLGCMYESGYGTEENMEKAIACYEMAAEKKYADSLLKLANFYLKGQGVPKDVEKGLALAEEAVKYKKESEGSLILAGIYSEYVPYGEYLAKAEELFLKADSLENKNALKSLAWFYDEAGPKSDDAKEAEYYRKSVEYDAEVARKERNRQLELLQYLLEQEKKGSTDCYERIAEIYSFYGKGKPDFKKYYEYSLKAAEDGNCNAMSVVGNAYAIGDYFEQDKAKAAKWLLESYKCNPENKLTLYHLMKLYTESIVGLAEYIPTRMMEAYVSGGAGFWEDYSGVKAEDAFAFFKKHADAGELNPVENGSQLQAYYSVGFCYAKGIGTERNGTLAKQYGYVESSKHIRTSDEYAAQKASYVNGKRSELNVLLKKVKSGYADGKDYYELAGKYLVNSSQSSMAKAYPYLVKACELQNTAALNLLASWYKEGRYVEGNLEKYAELYLKSAELGDQFAIAEAKSIYRFGNGVEQSCDMEIEWAMKRDPSKVFDRDVERYLVEVPIEDTPVFAEDDLIGGEETVIPSAGYLFFDGSGQGDEIDFYDYEISKQSKYKTPYDLTEATAVLAAFLSSLLSGGEDWKKHVYLGYSDNSLNNSIVEKFLKYKKDFVDRYKEVDFSFNKERMRVPASDKYHGVKVSIYIESYDGKVDSGSDEVMMFYNKDKNRWYVEELPQ